MKKNLRLIILFMALVGVMILVVLWRCRSVLLATVSLDTFAVGRQIINTRGIKS